MPFHACRPVAGVSLVELLIAGSLLAVLAAMSLPPLLSGLDHARGRAAARYLASRLSRARLQAASRAASVALRFQEDAAGVFFEVYQDGNGDGVTTRDIAAGVDRRIDAATRVSEQFPGAAVALAAGGGDSGAVRVGRSLLLSFSPAGTATSGSVYVVGRDGTQWAVRVLGATGRTRLQRLDPLTGRWAEAR